MLPFAALPAQVQRVCLTSLFQYLRRPPAKDARYWKDGWNASCGGGSAHLLSRQLFSPGSNARRCRFQHDCAASVVLHSVWNLTPSRWSGFSRDGLLDFAVRIAAKAAPTNVLLIFPFKFH